MTAKNDDLLGAEALGAIIRRRPSSPAVASGEAAA
jgi:hypothetical protein